LSVNRREMDGVVVNRGKSVGGVFGEITMKLVCRVVQLTLIWIILRLDKFIIIYNITS